MRFKKKGRNIGALICALLMSFSMAPMLSVAAQEDVDEVSNIHVFSDFEDLGKDQLPDFEELIEQRGGIELFSDDNDPDAVIGSDDREKVANTKIHPYSAVAWLSVRREDGTYNSLTGFLVAPDTVVTNAHGVYNSDTRAWAKKIEVYPGVNDHIAHLGSAVATVAAMHPMYLSGNRINQDYDLAVLKLNKSFGSEVSTLSLSTGLSLNQRLTVLGYPADKAVDKKFSQYKSVGIAYDLTTEQFKHNADTFGGSSGSPMLDSSNRVVGVNFGHERADTPRYNVGVRLTTSKINWINKVRQTHIPVYRVYNPNSSEHFYTIDATEKTSLVQMGWQDEGNAWATSSSGVPIYRLYNKNGGEHHYTSDVAEKNGLVNLGWTYEKVAWYAPQSDAYPVYRMYNPNQNSNNHHYTISAREKDALINMGWTNEGVAWLGY
ncbi:trypsin-like peptidase domain-containing protein [Allobaculum mucilyticum]|uniref:trypsin-like peptidase domain-containing protein n=1 Tax=Allobaculum mucilyticum TaxID=2834459 RepID=UPI001E521454|nr:trypsin-like peptidase domain-containing protein [Allobaculum mucilyticum]UNT96706.1 trypsin-like peptidase domain-containing protein [Allobaculum mucilyticum]